jgi:hypothetical protein
MSGLIARHNRRREYRACYRDGKKAKFHSAYPFDVGFSKHLEFYLGCIALNFCQYRATAASRLGASSERHSDAPLSETTRQHQSVINALAQGA